MPTRTNIDAAVSVVTSIQSQSTATAAVNGASLDTRDYPHGSRFLVVANVGNWTDGELTFSVEDSADDSSFAPLAVYSGALTAVAADNVTRTAAVRPSGSRPFIRVVTAESSAISTALPFSAHLIVIPPNC